MNFFGKLFNNLVIHKGDLIIKKTDVLNGKLIKKCLPDIVLGNVTANNLGLTSLENIPVRIEGTLDLGYNKLSNLEHFPKHVEGNVWLNGNRLTSLKGLPKVINGTLTISNNCLKSLRHCSKFIKGTFNACDNYLKSLVHGPIEVGGHYQVINNRIITLKHHPNKIDGLFQINYNQIQSLYLIRNKNYRIDSDLKVEKNFHNYFINMKKSRNDYYLFLYNKIINTSDVELSDVKWPEGFLESNYVKSVNKVKQFNL